METENPNLSKFISKFLKSKSFDYQGMNVKFTDVFADPELENTNYLFTISVDGNENKSFVPHFLLQELENLISDTLSHFYGEKSQDLSYEWKVLYNNKVFLTDKSVVISKENLSKIIKRFQRYLHIFKLKGTSTELVRISLEYAQDNIVQFLVKLRTLPGSNQVPLPLNALSIAMVEFINSLDLGPDFGESNENLTEVAWDFS